jgi:hypothetical protein
MIIKTKRKAASSIDEVTKEEVEIFVEAPVVAEPVFRLLLLSANLKVSLFVPQKASLSKY